jgi:hypothetical protein
MPWHDDWERCEMASIKRAKRSSVEQEIYREQLKQRQRDLRAEFYAHHPELGEPPPEPEGADEDDGED